MVEKVKFDKITFVSLKHTVHLLKFLKEIINVYKDENLA